MQELAALFKTDEAEDGDWVHLDGENAAANGSSAGAEEFSIRGIKVRAAAVALVCDTRSMRRVHAGEYCAHEEGHAAG
jgi:hypothetical protein